MNSAESATPESVGLETSGDATAAEIPEETSEPLPTSRAERARAVGALGLQLASTWAKAGAHGLTLDTGARELRWQQAHRESAESLFASLGRLRGVAAKLGQLLAQRPGSLPGPYNDALLDLSSRVPAMGYGMVKMRFITELGHSPRDIFRDFEGRPFAAASLGQVHRATLPDGRRAAVKVQYPAIEQTVRADLASIGPVLKAIARVGGWIDVEGTLCEIRERLLEELDYRREAEHTERFRKAYNGADYVIPGVHRAYSTGRILTLDYLDGEDLQSYLRSQPPLAERNQYAKRLLRFTWSAVLERGILHADPNPANYLFGRDGRLGIVDFGCVKQFGASFPAVLRELMRAATYGGTSALDEALAAGGLLRPDASPSERELMRDISLIWARPCRSARFDFGDARYLNDLVQLQRLVFGRGPGLIPAEWLFFGRQVVGGSYLLHRLGAHAAFGDTLAEFIGTA